MLVTDENLGILFVHLGLITEEQKILVLQKKKETQSRKNFYQLAIEFGFLKPGELEAAIEKFKTDQEHP